MRIHVKESTMVRPAVETPCTNIWISNLDAIMANNYHTLAAYFYRHNGAHDFFNSMLLKAALSHALVHFYPAAGRLRWKNDRIEINCNGEGVLFLDAECDGRMDDIEDFSPKPDLNFVPKVDYSLGISSFPLLLVQVMRFKCGGVCLGLATDHHVFDGTSALHFITTWSDIARGLDITVPPFLDRRVLSARRPPQPQFAHIEYQPNPTLKISRDKDPHIQEAETIFKRLRLTRDQIDALKSESKENDRDKEITYSTFKVIAGHTWRCMTKARKLPEDQATQMGIPVDGRSRMRPPLPQGYFGNAIFIATPIATAGELLSEPLKFTVRKIHDAIAQIDHDYMISALDYLESCDLSSISSGPELFKSPNMSAISWATLPIYNVDFGWGRPVYAGPGSVPFEGKTYVMASPENDGSIWVAIALPEDQMKLFEKVFYGDGMCRNTIIR